MRRYPVRSVYCEADRALPRAGVGMSYLGDIRARAVADTAESVIVSPAFAAAGPIPAMTCGLLRIASLGW